MSIMFLPLVVSLEKSSLAKDFNNLFLHFVFSIYFLCFNLLFDI